jgi:hypothetical protein
VKNKWRLLTAADLLRVAVLLSVPARSARWSVDGSA